MDLTSLRDEDTAESIAALLQKADQGPLGTVAAVCVYPQFVDQVAKSLKGTAVGCAAVINFPGGKGDPGVTFEATQQAIADGATEIDIVLDYESFLAGDRERAEKLLNACGAACGPDIKLKIILESAAFENYADLADACHLAIGCGADFLKTSTGFHPKGGASLEAAAMLLEAIQLSRRGGIGLKVSGGIKTVAQSATYIDLVRRMRSDVPLTRDNFRIGASSLLDDVLHILRPTLGMPDAAGPKADY